VADIISHAGVNDRFDSEQLSGAEPVRRIVGRNPSKADVEFYELDGRRVACKTYAARNLLIRHTVGRWLIGRETAAYEAAEAVAGLPGFLGRIGPFSLATEWVDAVPLRELAGEELDDGFFDRLSGILDELHDRGVALGDLHHRDVLVSDEGAVYVIDLATAWVLGPRPGALRRSLFKRFCESDRVSLARMRARFTAVDPDEAMTGVSPAAASWHRKGRRIKGLWDRLRGKDAG
jgi:hypothetical protein